jgi:hypothetical protein
MTFLYISLEQSSVMKVNTALIMFAVIAAFGLATATVVTPLVHQAIATRAVPSQSLCHFSHTGQNIGSRASGR